MAKFYVGQRVRGKRAVNPLCGHLEGIELVITGEDFGMPFGGYWLLNATSLAGKPVACWKCEAGEFLEPMMPEIDRQSELVVAELMDKCREGIAA